MIDCPNAATSGPVLRCACLPGLLLPLPPNPNYPCTSCRDEWAAGPPAPDRPGTWTPTLQDRAGPTLRPGRPRGLGDVLARWFARLGIRKRKGCGCARRQAALNRWFPFARRS